MIFLAGRMSTKKLVNSQTYYFSFCLIQYTGFYFYLLICNSFSYQSVAMLELHLEKFSRTNRLQYFFLKSETYSISRFSRTTNLQGPKRKKLNTACHAIGEGRNRRAKTYTLIHIHIIYHGFLHTILIVSIFQINS